VRKPSRRHGVFSRKGAKARSGIRTCEVRTREMRWMPGVSDQEERDLRGLVVSA